MAHITALYAGILALLIVVLAGRVVAVRRSASVSLGDGGSEVLIRRIRVHGNATENIPIGLLVMLVLELNHASATLLHGLGIALTVGRLAHAQGLSGSPGTSVGRFLGTTVSWVAIVWGAVVLIVGYFR
jgi:uncharacterized membrane protein YecN with MAPEG domain